MVTRIASAALLAAFGLGIGDACAADTQAGAAKAKEVCIACHGIGGNGSSPDFPKIGGQAADYLAHSLQSYKEGRRKNPIMAGFAAALTPQDIQNLAAYYSAQPSGLHIMPGAARLP